MITDLIVVPNFFDNPEEIVNFAKKQNFFNVKQHPIDKGSTDVYYAGSRTEKISKLDSHIHEVFKETLFKKAFSNVPGDGTCNIMFDGVQFFHYFDKTCTAKDENGNPDLHQDSGLYAGVIYLSDVALDNPDNHGTVIFNKNEQTLVIPYEYNKMIMYRSDYIHAPLAGFGNNVNDSRLSLCFFIDNLKIELHRNTLWKL